MMASGLDKVDIRVPASKMPRIWADAEKCKLGGVSRVFKSPEERKRWLWINQLTGVMMQWAYIVWAIGDDKLYIQERDRRNADPRKGDGGIDVPGTHTDVKASAMGTQRNICKYRLSVRPEERHRGWVYVFGLIYELPETPKEPGLVYLMGWAHEHDLPDEPETSGGFAGAYTIRVPGLRPMSEGDHPFYI